VGDHVVSKKGLIQNFGSLDWRPGPVKIGQKLKNTPYLGAPAKRTPTPNQKNNLKSKQEDLPHP